jgi:V/A-type H+/Na+-transporting ATPase subunit K
MKLFQQVAVVAAIGVVLLGATYCSAAEAPAAAQSTPAVKSDFSVGLISIAAALAVGLCALATGIAQSRIGAAGCGVLAEKPELSGTVILLLAIPETMVILGFVVAVVLLFT